MLLRLSLFALLSFQVGNFQNTTMIKTKTRIEKYYVNSAGCKMPFIEPFTKEVLKIMTQPKFTKCRKNKDLVVSEYDFDQKQYRLHIQDDKFNWADSYEDNSTLVCKYEKIVRDMRRKVPDNGYRVVYKRRLTQNLLLSPEVDYVIIKCYKINGTNNDVQLVQSDGMAFVQDLSGTTSIEGVNEEEAKDPQPSVIILGLDSMSRANFRRTMPKSFKYVQGIGWHTLQGLTKVGDNTLPNLVALLTGWSLRNVDTLCKLTEPGCFDKLPFVWKDFSRANYMTAMAEDCLTISTFNYGKPGFINQPVDYYLRPLMLAMQLNFNVTTGCVGRHLNFAYVWDFGQQFVQRFVHTAKSMFGIFWSNSFTHNYFDESIALDELFVEYLKQFERDGLFNRSIVILMSDHGMRFGDLRRTTFGYLEERMPMFYIYLPPWFRHKYPHLMLNLKMNRNRLSSQYDLYMTLQHLLQLKSKSNADIQPKSRECPGCQSIFFPLPINRTCSQAGIPETWCACNSVLTVTRQPYAKTLINAVLRQLNDNLVARNLTDLCANYTLKSLKNLDLKLPVEADTNRNGDQYFIAQFVTKPNEPEFEATFRWNFSKGELSWDVQEISRLNSYENDSQCTADKIAKKYCICKNAIQPNNRLLNP